MGWRQPNPALLVAHSLGIEPPELVLTATGGNMPQSLLHRAAWAISRGEIEVALVTGAECIYTQTATRRQGELVPLGWTTQTPESTPVPVAFGTDRSPATEQEVACGIELPVQAYPLLENALRGARGWSIEEHRAQIGRLWSGFSEVAARNPHAWLQKGFSASEIMRPGPRNRMIAFPYPKLCTANLQVDQGAAYVVCSVAAAERAGVPKDRWVFPLAGAEAQDHWFLSEREHLHESPPIRLAGKRALSLARVGIDDVGLIDLYSCFPAVVQIAAVELGLADDDPDRLLTVTGGLTFAGGPGNNYTTHGISTMMGLLREQPGEIGMTTGLGWYATKHAIALYSSSPPADEGHHGFHWEDVQPAVDALPRCSVDPEGSGEGTVETYTVLFDHHGLPELGIVACQTADGARTWANVTEPDDLEALTTTEGIGRRGVLDGGKLRSLR